MDDKCQAESDTQDTNQNSASSNGRKDSLIQKPSRESDYSNDKVKFEPASDDQDQEDEDQESLRPQLSKESPEQNPSPEIHEDVLNYLSFFNLQVSVLTAKNVSLIPIQKITQLSKKLEQNNIVWKGNSYVKTSKFESKVQYENFGFQILSITNNESPQIFQIQVRLGNFYLSILVFDELRPLPQPESTTENKYLGVGSFGKVYLYESLLFQKNNQNSKYVLKNLEAKKNNEFIDLFLSTLKEYSISLIMSALEIGPKISRNWGFDMIVKDNKIEFMMEYCGRFQVGKNQLNTVSQELKRNLKTMHHFHLIHHDIKPQNIAFSHHFNKWVFIDFGLSTVIEEKLGEKSMVKFLGTYQYTTEEMRKTFFKKGLVNLYWNDLFGFQQVIQFLAQEERRYEKQNNELSGKYNGDFNDNLNHSIYWNLNDNRDQRSYFNQFKVEKKVAHSIKTQTSFDELLYLFKHAIYTKDKQKLERIWQCLQGHFPPESLKSCQKERQKYDQFLQNIINFIDKCPLTKFVREIYREISDKGCQSHELQNKIQKKLRKPSFKVYEIEQNQSKPEEEKTSRIVILMESHIEKNNEGMVKISQFFTFKNENEIKNILMFKHNLLKLEEYFELYYNYITFRKRMFNCTFEEKVEVTEVFIAKVNKLHKNPIPITNYDQIRSTISKGRSLILNALNYLIFYSSERSSPSFVSKYFTEFITEFIFINPLVLSEENLENNYELHFVKLAVKVSPSLTSFLMMCFRIVESFKFLHYKNEHTYATYYEKDNYFGNYLYLYLTEKNIIANLKEQYFRFLLDDNKQRVEIQIDQKFTTENAWDIKEGIRLFQLLQQLVHSNWVQENNFYLKDYTYFKTKYLEFKLHSQEISTLSYRDRNRLEECLKAKYIKLVLVSQTLPQAQQEELLITYKKYENSKTLTIKHFQITEKFAQDRDIRNYTAILAKIDYLINCPQISNEYLSNHRSYVSCSNGKLQNCISQAVKMVDNLKIHFFGMFYLCDLIRFSKPLRSWKYRVAHLPELKQEIQVLEDNLFRKVVKILRLLIKYIENEDLPEFTQFKGRLPLYKCKKDVFNVFNHLNFTLRFREKEEQQDFYIFYQKYYKKFSEEIIELKYQGLKRFQQEGGPPNIAEQVKSIEIRDCKLRLTHYEYRIKLQKLQFNDFLAKFDYYNEIFCVEGDFEFEFLSNYLKVVNCKKMNILNTIYRQRERNFLQHCDLQDQQYYTPRVEETKQIMRNCIRVIDRLTNYFKKESSFYKFAFHIQILNFVIIHMWRIQTNIFFEQMIEKQSNWILSETTVHFGRTYYTIIDLIGTLLMPYEPERSKFVRAFILYASKNLKIKLQALKGPKLPLKTKQVVFYEVFVMLQIVAFFYVNELYQNLGFIVKLLKVAVLSLQFQTNFSRPLTKQLIYTVYYNLISEMEIVKRMWGMSSLFARIKMTELSYRKFILRKIIKQDSLNKYFFTEDCPAMIKDFLQLKLEEEDSRQLMGIKYRINNNIHRIRHTMLGDPSKKEMMMNLNQM